MMNYEILLINVSRDHSGFSEAFRDSIGQYSIASFLRQKDFKGYVYSGNVSSCKKIIADELESKNTTIVGFYAAADNIRVVSHVIRWIKDRYPECKTVVGGPQAAGLDYQFFESTKNDFAIIGEGEIPIYKLLSSIIDGFISLEHVPSLVRPDYTNRKLLINTSENSVINNLDTLGYPSRDDSLTGRLRQGEIVGIITGRGCPYQCSFCYEGANAKNVRFRSIDNVMSEIDYVQKNNKKVKIISIYDDTFTLKKDRILEFCEEIKKRNLLWFCEGHVSFVVKQREVLKKMIESGLSCIQFGIESGSDEVLNLYNKNTNYNMIIEAIEICKELGIHSITGNFIIGGAKETRETIRSSMKLAKELIHRAKGIIELYTVYFAPYPNTKMVKEPEKFDMEIYDDLIEKNINSMRTPVVRTKGLERNEIYDLKHEFDEFLKKEYDDAVKQSRKQDILQGLMHEGKRISLNPTWERRYLSYPHLSVFIEHLSEKEQVFNEDYYIIRTFEDVKEENEKLISDVGVFTDLEKDVLLFSTGIYTAKEMALKFNVTIEDVKLVYERLNDRCLVYISEF